MTERRPGRRGLRPSRRFARLGVLTVSVLCALLLVIAAACSWGREHSLDNVVWGALAATSTAAGVLIVTRHRGHPIGWLLCGLGLNQALLEALEGWGYVAADTGAAAGPLAEWVVSWQWIADASGWLVVLLLFPSGRVVSRGTRAGLVLVAAGCVLALPGQALTSRSDSLFASGRNPYAVDSALVEVAYVAGVTLLFVALLIATRELVVRYRSADRVGREQIKWLAYAAGLLAATAPVAIVAYYDSPAVQASVAVALLCLPLSIGVAILRHQLFDIDLVINRTLVYGALSLVLAVSYFTSVLLLRLVLSPLTGESHLAVGASTLAVAALFRPLRSRIQAMVDRRFYRSRYDATRILDMFSGRLRHSVDLDAIDIDLRDVVGQTMQPKHLSLWLQDSSRPPHRPDPSGVR